VNVLILIPPRRYPDSILPHRFI